MEHTLQSVFIMNDQPLQPTLWRTCRVLANRTRLRMLSLLFREPGLTVSRVAQRVEAELPVASQYLRALESRGLLMARRRGRWVYYQPPTARAGGFAAPLVAALRLQFRRDSQSEEPIFKLATAFTHPRRIEIFRALGSGAQTFKRLQGATSVSGWTLRRHLNKLERRGFAVRDGDLYKARLPGGPAARVLARWAAA